MSQRDSLTRFTVLLCSESGYTYSGSVWICNTVLHTSTREVVTLFVKAMTRCFTNLFRTVNLHEFYSGISESSSGSFIMIVFLCIESANTNTAVLTTMNDAAKALKKANADLDVDKVIKQNQKTPFL
jgi:hypothetical protein